MIGRIPLLVAGLCFTMPGIQAAEQTGGPRAGPALTQELYDEIAAVDLKLFTAVFGTCDIPTLATLVADDFEFYHDKDGLSSTSGAHFVKAIEGTCERQKTGVDYRARREIVPGSMKVYPLNNYGAIEVGEHRFYQLLPGSRKNSSRFPSSRRCGRRKSPAGN